MPSCASCPKGQLPLGVDDRNVYGCGVRTARATRALFEEGSRRAENERRRRALERGGPAAVGRPLVLLGQVLTIAPVGWVPTQPGQLFHPAVVDVPGWSTNPVASAGRGQAFSVARISRLSPHASLCTGKSGDPVLLAIVVHRLTRDMVLDGPRTMESLVRRSGEKGG